MTKDYCDVAVNTDIKILGFSDHGPLPNSFYNLGDGYDESRMDFEVLKNEYLPDFEKSKEEFKDELILEKGLEMEYVPGHDDYYQNLLDYVDYLILGEHWIKDPFNDSGRLYYSKLDYSNVMYYAKDVEKALDSKLFKIIAHPDIFLSNYVSKNGIMRELDEEAYFEDSYEFIKGLDVTQLHVFSYSERPGTKALQIDYVVPPQVKHERSQRLLDLSDEKTHAFYQSFIGQTMPVLLEKSKAGQPMHGFTPNYIRVEVENRPELDNHIVMVRLGEMNETGDALKGKLLE